jgi:hypothetical protein
MGKCVYPVYRMWGLKELTFTSGTYKLETSLNSFPSYGFRDSWGGFYIQYRTSRTEPGIWSLKVGTLPGTFLQLWFSSIWSWFTFLTLEPIFERVDGKPIFYPLLITSAGDLTLCQLRQTCPQGGRNVWRISRAEICKFLLNRRTSQSAVQSLLPGPVKDSRLISSRNWPISNRVSNHIPSCSPFCMYLLNMYTVPHMKTC